MNYFIIFFFPARKIYFPYLEMLYLYLMIIGSFKIYYPGYKSIKIFFSTFISYTDVRFLDFYGFLFKYICSHVADTSYFLPFFFIRVIILYSYIQ